MRTNDAEVGKPTTLFKGTKAAIEALTAVEGMIAVATDTHEIGYYNGTSWKWTDYTGGGASAFTDLTDTFPNYTGKGGQFVRVKATEDVLETATIPGGGDVLGPATSTDGHLAVWDGTDSKTLKDGGAVPAGGGDVATDAIFDAKGDLAVGTGANTAQRLAVGANGARLIADSSQTTGLKYAVGTTLVTNGFFDSDVAGWSATAPATITHSSGAAVVNRGGGSFGDHAYQDITVVAGRIYLVSLRVTAQTHGAIISILDNSVNSRYFYSTVTSRTHAVCFMHKANSTTIRLIISASEVSTATVTIDDVIVVEM